MRRPHTAAPDLSRAAYRIRPACADGLGDVDLNSSVLRSKRAIQVNVEIMRAFVRLRQILASHADLARKLDALERKYDLKSIANLSKRL